MPMPDPTREEMIEFLRATYGNEEGFDFDVEEAVYWFAAWYHSGQWSNLYSVLSTSEFRPGAIGNGPELDSMAEMMLEDLIEQFTNPA